MNLFTLVESTKVQRIVYNKVKHTKNKIIFWYRKCPLHFLRLLNRSEPYRRVYRYIWSRASVCPSACNGFWIIWARKNSFWAKVLMSTYAYIHTSLQYLQNISNMWLPKIVYIFWWCWNFVNSSYFSPLFKSIVKPADVDYFMIEEDPEERDDFIANLESRFFFLAADARSTLRLLIYPALIKLVLDYFKY